MYMNWRHLSVALLGSSLASCTTPPETLTPLTDPQRPPVEASSSVKLYDLPSFYRATVSYPADQAGEFHQIPVGEYLLHRTIDSFGRRDVSSVRLADFTGKCAITRLVLPQVRCTMAATLSFVLGRQPRQASAVAEIEVGQQHLLRNQTLLIAHAIQNEPFIRQQVKQAVDALSDALRDKIVRP